MIDTGLYGSVRHPMYSVTMILFLSMPLVLEKGLEGYTEYKKKVKYKILPFVW